MIITKEITADRIPHVWDRVTFRQYVSLCRVKDDYMSILEIFLNIPVETLKSAKVENFETMVRTLAFMKKPPEWDESPYKLGPHQMPADITWESVGQFEDTRRVILSIKANDELDELEKYADIVAIYLQPIYDGGNYDSKRLVEIKKIVDTYSCVEVVSLGRFFYVKCLSLINNMPHSFPKRITQARKRRQAFRNFQRRLGSILRFISFRGVTYSKKKP